MNTKFALVGNPNCGKTTLFNALTGSNQFVGNWPGVTVEKKEGKLKGNKNIIITDLPGIYSLSPYTLEEVVARNYLLEESPSVIINIIDATNIERNLYLTTQLLELNIPVVLAVNMMDIIEKNGTHLNLDNLSKELGVPIIEISALKGTGIKELTSKILEVSKTKESFSPSHKYSKEVESVLSKIENICLQEIGEEKTRFYSIKIFERDEKIIDKLKLSSEIKSEIEKEIKYTENLLDDDSESIITTERYDYITSIITSVVTKKSNNNLTTSDKIDKIVTNRFLALPIFAFIMFLVYFVSVTTLGAFLTDYTNDVIFGEIIAPFVNNLLVSINCADWLVGLIVDGIIGGVGAVLGFVPQMLLLFTFLAFLEASGYMARVAFIMDRIFRKFGLSGKSFIPILIGTGCGVPGIMASRTIENDVDRKLTIMTTTFIPCGAKLPIIALISGSLLGGAWWVAPSAYFLGIIAIIFSGVVLKKTKLFAGEPAPFVIELPAYHMPTMSNILRSTWERGSSFIKKAGTIILLSTIIIWFLQSFGFVNGKFIMVDDMSDSILKVMGSLIAPIFIPLGFGDWRFTVATITGLIAKENVVSTFGVLFGFAEISENGAEIWSTLSTNMTAISAYSFLVFNLLCAPCFAAMGAIKREMNSAKWFWIAISYQTILAYLTALFVYQMATFYQTSIFTLWTFVAILIGILFIYLLARPSKNKMTN